MKYFLYSLIFTGCFFISDLLAQQRPFGPTHPSFMYMPLRPNLSIDTVFCYGWGGISTDPISGEILETNPEKYYYTRSEDLLTDTVHYEISTFIHRYNEKNQLLYSYQISKKDIFSGYQRDDFEYDEEGRVVRLKSNWIEPSRNPFVDPKITFMYERTWDYSTIQMTEKGYIFDGIECELDYQGRITLIKYKATEDSIVELDGKKYRVNDAFITYTDSSYTYFGCFYIGSRTRREEPIRWEKSTYVYNANGDLISSLALFSDDGIIWRNVQELLLFYLTHPYSGDNEVSNFIVNKAITNVYAQFGSIYIFTENDATVQIFDLAGRLVKQQTLSVGENRIKVYRGFYIVKVGNESFKVFNNF